MRPPSKEEVEQHDIERGEHPDQGRFQHQEADHEFLDPERDGFPGGGDAEGHQEGREQDEGHGCPIDAELVAEAAAEPRPALHELKRRRTGVEPAPGHQREQEHDGAGDQRGPARIAQRRRIITPQHQDEDRADDGEEDEARQDPEAEHQRTPPTRYQVMKAATPSIMAKA